MNCSRPPLHCGCPLQVNGNEAAPEVIGVMGILQAYYASVRYVELYGPTLFAPIINQAAAVAASLRTSDPRYKRALPIENALCATTIT